MGGREGGVKGSNKSETPKCIYTIQSLQNGRIAESKIFFTRGRWSVQAQSKRYILLCSFTEKTYAKSCAHVLA